MGAPCTHRLKLGQQLAVGACASSSKHRGPLRRPFVAVSPQAPAMSPPLTPTHDLALTLITTLTSTLPPAQLNIDYQAGGAFPAFVSAALGKTASFNPYADNLRFLLGAYIMEDVIPTAWEVSGNPLPLLKLIPLVSSALVVSGTRGSTDPCQHPRNLVSAHQQGVNLQESAAMRSGPTTTTVSTT